ncbi:phosphoribosylanthranilate isomerase [Haliea sp.]
MSRTLVKICGITSSADARAACEAGADALGLVFYAPSTRCVTPEQAREIVAAVPPFVAIVALFVDETVATIQRILECVSVDCIQFHGAETPAFCDQFQRPYLKALRMRPGVDIGEVASGYSSARGLLLDSWQPGVPGGTGQTFDWTAIPAVLPRPLVLAGGLDEHNVAAAIAGVGPAAVDVSGGVESAPGIKDAGKMRRFIAAVRG